MTHVDLRCQVTICRAVKFRRWRSLVAALSGVVGSELLGGDYQAVRLWLFDGGYQAVRLGTVRCDTAGLLDVALLDVTLLSETSLQGC